MLIETGTLMKVIYQRAARWLGVEPRFIKLSGKLFPE
jgi:hypothetical protein